MFSGVINVDKPAGLSSARVVARVKRLLPRGTKIGHAGTLDPFATGVLLLLVGKATKLCERLMGQAKQYEATVKLGATTPTLDPDSAETPFPEAHPAEPNALEKVLQGFVGHIEQRPPAYSALKIEGRPAYQLARKGQELELKPRIVRVDAIEVLEYDWPMLTLRIDCGRGTYVRSLARDIGQALGSSGYLTQLRRTRVGPFRVQDAATLEQITAENVGQFIHEPTNTEC